MNQLNHSSGIQNQTYSNQPIQQMVQPQSIQSISSFQVPFQQQNPLLQPLSQIQSGISQQIPMQLQPAQVAIPFPFLIGPVPISDESIQQQQSQSQQNSQTMPNTIAELQNEIQKEQKKIEELRNIQNYLMTCTQLLHNPDQLKSATKTLEQFDLYLKDMQAMVDEKIKNAISCIDFVFNEK